MNSIDLHNPLAEHLLARIRPVSVEGQVEIQAAVTAGLSTWTAIASYTVANDERVLWTGFGINVEDPTYDYSGGTSASLVFRLMVDSQPVRDFSGFSQQRGSIESPAPIFVPTRPGQTLIIQVARVVAFPMPSTITGLIIGQAWPQNYCLPFDPPQSMQVGHATNQLP
jgi:hypothetical protein